jgi:protoporphyrinogen oxidase
MSIPKFTILGAGLSGLSASYHLGHENCRVYEAKPYAGGHAYSHLKDGCIWDEGPHISFTQNDYVKNLFESSSKDGVSEFDAILSNYFQGNWIPHPSQVNLYAIPEPLRSDCLEAFLNARRTLGSTVIKNYGDWLEVAFGSVFSEKFSTPYTKKYWTVHPRDLGIDWIGDRIHYPDIKTVVSGSKARPLDNLHYYNQVRYPKDGGFISFSKSLQEASNIFFNHEVKTIDLNLKRIYFKNGNSVIFNKLINTLPLPIFINLCNPPDKILKYSAELCCTSLLLINIVSSHKSTNTNNFIYVYDEDKLSTRITFIDKLSKNNAPINKSGIQVEVYESKYRPFSLSHLEIAEKVKNELIEMGIIKSVNSIHTQFIPFANVIFDRKCSFYKNKIFEWLETFGLMREPDDLHPLSSWENSKSGRDLGSIILAGRFGQWKYFWSDDCILRGKQIACSLCS